MGPDRESEFLEYKATLRTLLIGVADAGVVHGLDSDYATLHKPGKNDRDLFQLHLANIVEASMGTAAATNVRAQMHLVDGHDVCRVHVDRCRFPVDAKVVHDKNGQHVKSTEFYVRVMNGTKACTETEKQKHIKNTWG